MGMLQADEYTYRTNRQIEAINVNVPAGQATLLNLYQAATSLTDRVIIGPFPLITNSADTVEYEGVSWGQESYVLAWSNVMVGYVNHTWDYDGDIVTEPGWIKGTKSAYGKYGAYLWLLQNQLNFDTSPDDTYIVSNLTFQISNVLIGTIGDFPPATNVSMTWPEMDATNQTCPSLTSEMPSEGSPETVKFNQDLRGYYEIATPHIDIYQTETNVCWNDTEAHYLNLTSNSSLAGANAQWTSEPAGISGYGTNVTFYPNQLPPTTYVVRASSTLLTNYYDTCIVRVLKVDIEQVVSNTCWKMTGGNLNLTTNSYLDGGYASWESVPAGISGTGTNITFNPSNLTPTNYLVTAHSSLLTNCNDTCTVRVLKIDIEQTETNVCWKMTNATLNLTTNSYFGGGVTWYSDPAGISGSAAAITFNPSALSPTTYVVTAWANELTNCYDTCTVRVIKVDIVQTNQDGHVYCTNCVPFNLTPDSWTNVTWTISPYMGTNGTQFSATSNWTGSGFATTNGTNIWVYSGPVSNTYTLTAYAVELTNCAETATIEVMTPNFLDLNWMETTNETAHNTSLYQTNVLVLRRADKFKVEAKLSKGYTNTCYDVWFQNWHTFDGAPTTNTVPLVASDLGATDWYCKLLSVSNNADQTKTVQMEINLPSTNCAIGEYQWRALVTPKVSTNIVLDATNFPGQVIILFNPWKSADSTYMSNSIQRYEYVTKTIGRMWQGERTNKNDIAWTYGQFKAPCLAVLLYSMNGNIGAIVPALSSIERSDPIKVSRHLSHACNNTDGAGLLQGNWSTNVADYAGGTFPWTWTGSDQILQAYNTSHNTVKYGQCWVFGGLLTSLLRCAGIPARPITNYDSGHDGNANKLIDYDYEKIGGVWTATYAESIWNFHVWCDAWLKRPDRSGCDGWQAVDGTPQETSGGLYQCGPAPHTAVKGDTSGDYDVDFVYAEVAGSVRIRYKISGVWTTVTNIADQVGHDISTKNVGLNTLNDITSSYK